MLGWFTYFVARVYGCMSVQEGKPSPTRKLPAHFIIVRRVQVVRHAYVRRSKLYYLRNRSGKSARLRTRLTD